MRIWRPAKERGITWVLICPAKGSPAGSQSKRDGSGVSMHRCDEVVGGRENDQSHCLYPVCRCPLASAVNGNVIIRLDAKLTQLNGAFHYLPLPPRHFPRLPSTFFLQLCIFPNAPISDRALGLPLVLSSTLEPG